MSVWVFALVIDPDGAWQIECSPQSFGTLRENEAFHLLVALARLVNSIRFTHHALIDGRGSDTPVAVRQRMNAFMYTSALLFEGVELSKRLGKHYRELEAFKQGFQEIHRDKDANTLVYKTLRPLRNVAVFHSDPTAVARNLEMLDDPAYVFVRAEGRGAGYTYYELADEAALSVVFGARSDSEYEARARRLIQAVADLSVRFLKASDKLISSALGEPEWQLTQPPMTWAARARQLSRKVRRWASRVVPILRQRI